ncbi:MAG: HAD-IC family P-type ATPase [Rickettsiales bacterium]|jgi:calcium-translocating P-type ATPase|nr:HAD-IC family P-type ATPase [Rickettsiales bacterium]
MMGLTTQEANELLIKNGANELPEEKLEPLWLTFVKQFAEPLTYILMGSSVISVFLGEYFDAAFIFAVVSVNAIVGTLQEYGASKSAQSLKKMVEVKTFVLRDNIEVEIPARELVVGDLVLLKDGSKIPADIILHNSNNLKIDESMLTGESLPVNKNSTETKDNLNKVFAGTIVLKGQGQGLVSATALNTEIGKIAEKITQKSEAKSPLTERLEKFTSKLTLVMLGLIAIISIVSFMNGIDWKETLLLASSLGVAAIPEGLPIAVTICLAIGMNRMAKKNVIVKNLMAVEALGSCTMIASDKTGTLTINEMSVVDIITPISQIAPDTKIADLKPLKEEDFNSMSLEKKIAISFVLPNEASRKDNEFFGDSVDIAFLKSAINKGYDINEIKSAYPLIELLPYTSEEKYSASFNKVGDKTFAFVKGAPETIMEMCGINKVEKEIKETKENNIKSQLDDLSSKGLRVLAVACGKSPDKKLENLEFLGLIAMLDPLRPEAKSAVQKCQDAGIRVAMITGDNPKTAFAISSELGFVKTQNEVVSGDDIATATANNTIDGITKNAKVYARVAPIQKLDIVQSMQRNGNYVAVTGDGVNDAPALKNANVGIAMGNKGTDIARESANIILTDDNFASIIHGVEEGRLTYSNIRKIVFFLMSTSFAEIGVFLLAIFFKLPIPFTSLQLLWINLITEVVQGIALAMEGKDGTEMTQPPRRPDEPIFDGIMIRRIILSSVIMITGCFGVFKYFYDTTQDVVMARSCLLFVMIMFQNIQTFNARSENNSAFGRFFSNPFLLIAVGFVTLLHVVASYMPFFDLFLKIDPLGIEELKVVLSVALSIIIVMELEKVIRKIFCKKNNIF